MCTFSQKQENTIKGFQISGLLWFWPCTVSAEGNCLSSVQKMRGPGVRDQPADHPYRLFSPLSTCIVMPREIYGKSISLYVCMFLHLNQAYSWVLQRVSMNSDLPNSFIILLIQAIMVWIIKISMCNSSNSNDWHFKNVSLHPIESIELHSSVQTWIRIKGS